jgi:hypothetical protein
MIKHLRSNASLEMQVTAYPKHISEESPLEDAKHITTLFILLVVALNNSQPRNLLKVGI